MVVLLFPTSQFPCRLVKSCLEATADWPNQFADLAQFAADLPDSSGDLSTQHDHYLCGTTLKSSTNPGNWDLFTERPDKAWSLKDCISFMVMQEKGVNDALAVQQAGFRALLLQTE